MAKSITLSAQFANRSAERCMNETISKILKEDKIKDRVVAGDTDSGYLCLNDIVQKHYQNKSIHQTVKFVNKVAEEVIQPALKKNFEKLKKQMNCYENRLQMEREIIASRGVWTTKKRYILAVYDDGGITFEEPKFKIMGMESQRSSTPEWCRKKLTELYGDVVTKTEKDVQQKIKQVKKEFDKLSIEEISSPIGVNNVEKFMTNNPSALYKSGTPVHVRGSILYNKRIDEMGLNNHLTKIKSGDKIKYCYMKLPNPIQENVFAFPDYFDRRLELHEFVDRKRMYEKTLLEPIKAVLAVVGWQDKKKSALKFKGM